MPGNWKAQKCGNGKGNERFYKPESVLCMAILSPRVSDEPELAPHWVHSSIRKLIPGRHCRFVIVGPRVVVYRLTDSWEVDDHTAGIRRCSHLA